MSLHVLLIQTKQRVTSIWRCCLVRNFEKVHEDLKFKNYCKNYGNIFPLYIFVEKRLKNMWLLTRQRKVKISFTEGCRLCGL